MARAYRVRGIPLDWRADRVRDLLAEHCNSGSPSIDSLAPETHGRSQSASVSFQNAASPSVSQIRLPSTTQASRPQVITIDDDFLGITTLYMPPSQNHRFDIVALSGLGGHAFGSFKQRGGDHMWIRDSIPYDLTVGNSQGDNQPPGMGRVIIYGYDSSVDGSTSFQNLEDLAISFRDSLLPVLNSKDLVAHRPILFIAHSLGGLILKQMLVLLSKSEKHEHMNLLNSVYGIAFFGVPHDGMDIRSLVPMVKEGPNRSLLESISHINSQLLGILNRDFHQSLGGKGESEIICFYETSLSPTAKRNRDGTLRMNGPNAVLVTKSSATHGRHWEVGPDYNYAIDRTHSEIVKFGPQDHEYEKVLKHLQAMAKQAIVAQRRRRRNQSSNTAAQLDECDRKCLQELRLSDPVDDKRRIEATKGGLFRAASNWILEHDDFQRWQHDDDARLLWIKGDPGKGKTMLLVTVVEELESQLSQQEDSSIHTSMLSYFFCQGTNRDLNNATAVLRGLIYMLVAQRPPLISHLRKKYDHAGSKLFEDANSYFALSEILKSMLSDGSPTRIYLVIDALDECVTDQGRLMKLITDISMAFSHVKWIVSSRNEPGIEQQLNMEGSGMRLSLEVTQNAEDVSRAVNAYIDFKVQQLKSLQENQDLSSKIRYILRKKAKGTFLWVAIVIEELQNARPWHMIEVVEGAPVGLDEIFKTMIAKTQQDHDWDLCQRILSAATLAYRPLHLSELPVVSGLPKSISGNTKYIHKLVALCGSFLTVLDDHFVYIIHQSAKDFLSKATAEIFSTGHAEIHRDIVERSIEAMQCVLKRDIYELRHPGCLIDELEVPDIDPLAAVRYSCTYWVRHMCDGSDTSHLEDHAEHVLKFLRRFLLYWLEALSLIQHVGEGVRSMLRLENLFRRGSSNNQLVELIQDLCRFLLHNRWVIENAPLQTYESALIFSPANCLIRELFRNEEPKWIVSKPEMENTWNACRQTLEGHGDWVRAVAFTLDGQLLASASDDRTIKLWDPDTGALRQTLEGHGDWVRAIAFTPDGQLLASASDDRIIKLWDPVTGALRKILDGHRGRVTAIAFAPDSQLLASASNDYTIKLWDPDTGALHQTFGTHAIATEMSFCASEPHLHTDIGYLNLNLNTGSRILSAAPYSCPASYCNYALGNDNSWITRYGYSILWLPPDYRPFKSAISTRTLTLNTTVTTMALGCASGRVILIGLLDAIPSENPESFSRRL